MSAQAMGVLVINLYDIIVHTTFSFGTPQLPYVSILLEDGALLYNTMVISCKDGHYYMKMMLFYVKMVIYYKMMVLYYLKMVHYCIKMVLSYLYI